MIGSTTPVVEQPDWHPVHRANALLREALQRSIQSIEPLEDRNSSESLPQAIASAMKSRVHITYSTPLAARLDDLAVEENAIPGLDSVARAEHALSDPPVGFLDDDDDSVPTVEPDDGLGDPPHEAWDEDDGSDLDDPELLQDSVPLDPEARLLPRQVHVQTLLGEFHRRQRYASLLVAGSIVTAFLLTVCGFVLAASVAAPLPADSAPLPSLRSTSIAWQKPAPGSADAPLQLAVVSTNRAAKGEPLSRPQAGAKLLPSGAAPSTPQTILAARGRRIAFGPLLPPSHARYFLIRGLPPEATLSTGRQSGRGAWLVKGESISDLTLSLGQAPAGDYPVEVYVLESGDGPQARRNFVLRITPPDQAFATGSGPTAAPAAADMQGAPAVDEPKFPAESTLLRERAMRLLGEGDIAGARLLLLHLAERGDSEAAYDLARTFDREILAELGARGLDGDPAHARGWYERASQDGNVKAAERLKILASLSGTGPSD
ncbi:MAG: hypothetical protein H7X78_08950 [Methyloceanibacter sp.]|nr:hypothetical protein [Methyloceanibacter sp.]